MPNERTLDASVLVAEDDQEPAAAILAQAGANVTRVTDGAAARAALDATKPQAVVAGVRWPKGNGFSILEITRRLHPGLPVVLFTGQPAVTEAVRAMQAGAETYLSKPLGEDLVRAVSSGMARRAGVGLERSGDRPARPESSKG